MKNIDEAIVDFKNAKARFTAVESAIDDNRAKQAELRLFIKDANTKIDSMSGAALSMEIDEAMNARQVARELPGKVQDAKSLLDALEKDDERHWPELRAAHAEYFNSLGALQAKYINLVNNEISNNHKKVTDKLLPHLGGLAELAALKKVSEGEAAAIEWVKGELLKLVESAMSNVDINKIGVRMDVLAMVREDISCKYNAEIKAAGSPGFQHKIRHNK